MGHFHIDWWYACVVYGVLCNNVNIGFSYRGTYGAQWTRYLLLPAHMWHHACRPFTLPCAYFIPDNG